MKLSTVLAACSVLLPLATGCAARHDDEPEGASPELTFETRQADHVAGSYARAGVAVRFDFAIDGVDKKVSVSTSTGTPLVVSTIHPGGNHTTSVLGGRLVVEDTGEAPKYTGDRQAEKDLHAMPEAETMGALEAALEAAGVPASLLPTERADGVRTDSVGYGNCGAWIGQFGWATCGTNFFGWSSLTIRTNCSTNHVLYVLDGNPGSTDPWCASYDKGGWYWGRNINFYNSGAICDTASCWHPVNGVPVYFGH